MPPATPKTTWEYRVENIRIEQDICAILNTLGALGWELVWCNRLGHSWQMLFKRET